MGDFILSGGRGILQYLGAARSNAQMKFRTRWGSELAESNRIETGNILQTP